MENTTSKELESVLEAKWEEYKQKVKQGGDAQKIYQEEIWPLLLQVWKEKPKVIPTPKKFDVSIHTLGTSPEATTFAILGTQADEIYILHTEETKKFISKIETDTGKKVYPIEIGKSDVASIYKQVIKILEKHPEKSIALDITSGTKAMSAGLSAAGFFFRRFFETIRVVYVDNDLYDLEVRRPKAGTEKLIILPSPHEVLADVDVLLALENYKRKDYISAHKYFLKAREKTGNQKFKIFEDLCLMYGFWFNLNIKDAYKKSQQILEKMNSESYSMYTTNELLDYGYLEKQSQILKAIDNFTETEDFGNIVGVIALAETLLYLSSESLQKKQLALSALYVYRALELLLQQRMKHMGKNFETASLLPEEKENLKQKLAMILGEDEEDITFKTKLGLLELLTYLLILQDELIKRIFNEDTVKKLARNLKTRNASLLIHGLKSPSENEIEKLYEKTEKLLEEIKKETNISITLEPHNLGIRVLHVMEA